MTEAVRYNPTLYPCAIPACNTNFQSHGRSAPPLGPCVMLTQWYDLTAKLSPTSYLYIPMDSEPLPPWHHTFNTSFPSGLSTMSRLASLLCLLAVLSTASAAPASTFKTIGEALKAGDAATFLAAHQASSEA
jgi:hypothetical protein